MNAGTSFNIVYLDEERFQSSARGFRDWIIDEFMLVGNKTMYPRSRVRRIACYWKKPRFVLSPVKAFP